MSLEKIKIALSKDSKIYPSLDIFIPGILYILLLKLKMILNNNSLPYNLSTNFHTSSNSKNSLSSSPPTKFSPWVPTTVSWS
jgi:hypothetical protein